MYPDYFNFCTFEIPIASFIFDLLPICVQRILYFLFNLILFVSHGPGLICRIPSLGIYLLFLVRRQLTFVQMVRSPQTSQAFDILKFTCLVWLSYNSLLKIDYILDNLYYCVDYNYFDIVASSLFVWIFVFSKLIRRPTFTHSCSNKLKNKFKQSTTIKKILTQ